MSPTQTQTARSVRAALLFLGFLAIASIPYIENHEAIISWAGFNSQSPLDEVNTDVNETSIASLHPEQPPEQQSRRRLASRKPLLDEATQQKQMKSYLGGLYPPVDKDMFPLYLRDTTDKTNLQVLDMYSPSGEPVRRNRDLVFFWHIPKVCLFAI